VAKFEKRENSSGLLLSRRISLVGEISNLAYIVYLVKVEGSPGEVSKK